MSGDTWHKNVKSWKNINEFLFKNETMSDCSFVVGVGNEKVRIPAHKYILAGYSPEFYNLFYLMNPGSDEIPINDVSVENLSSFLEYLYTEKTKFNMENIEELIKLANRYSVENFKYYCSMFLLHNVTVNNVLSVMDKYFDYELPSRFETGCLKIINKNGSIFKDPSFYEISNKTLTTILKSDELKGFKESIIFRGVNKWTERFCDKNNQAITSNNKRSALGSALQHIRFGAMTIPEFTQFTYLDNFILTSIEIIEIFQFIGNGKKKDCPYSGIKRDGEKTKLSFYKDPIVSLSPIMYSFDGYDLFEFFVLTPVYLLGFEVYGRDLNSLDIQNPEKFIIQLKDGRTGHVEYESIVEINYDGSQKTYEMLFDEVNLIDSKKLYKVSMIRQTPGNFYNYCVDRPACDLLELLSLKDPKSDVGFGIRKRLPLSASIIFSI